ncbi:hypothetical protein [Parabacteroides sp. AM08-6]|uniref:hypothetical protein n=1 Tax=Parabacteroides sp. AM08-6 TaxID=2292053 RepID=UPI000EFEE16C|nr:hypothetical protein [Parabacteroides sp. AM08-6]RHJ81801.1 hypothetical protein DW103_10805 [Parabacteroides sp. AM08-6]
MNIDELLERYFEGETSAEEEQQLRTFFNSGKVPGHLAAYIPLFAYFDTEITRKKSHPESQDEIFATLLAPRENRLSPAKRKGWSARRSTLYILSGVAACVLALLGISRLIIPTEPCFCSDNYVVINGRCYTDIHKVRSLAMEALQEVATPANNYFPEADKDEADRVIIDNQLKELGSIFSDDE